MVAGCLYPILKSILKTEDKILSWLQWTPWSYSHLHSMRAWPCDLNPYFIALAKRTALLVAGHRMRKRFKAKPLWSRVPAIWGAGEAGLWLLLMITPALPPPLPSRTFSQQRQHLLPAAYFFPLSQFGQQQEWQYHMSSAEAGHLNQDFLMQVSPSEQAPLRGTLYLFDLFLHDNFSLPGHWISVYLF